MDNKKSYYAIIPANVRYDEHLTPNAKLLYGEITALCNEKGFCWAGDKYFATLYKVSRISIQKWLKSLEDRNYIKREVVYKAGSKEIDARYITIVNNPSKEMFTTPSKQKLTDNNTSFNNTNNNVQRSKALESDFEKLWKLYPNKKGKQVALKAYKRAIKDGVSNKQIQTGIVAYKKYLTANGTEQQFMMHGGTFFNQRSWDDDWSISQSQPTKHEKVPENLIDDIYNSQ
ncbi:helix-turn-helix domain-containing protein [Enterococcus asini]|uniref:helix-turn-helix domain-containing protein n=1 Tax=Enterococcus asini TaxID=57732 RepID=UPI0009003092|nr:helix-turn-helix domain-containing protein [Enterococcus asini]OJG12978.1 hypothetical protein RU94_GL001677 [Enterococcus asini]